MKEPKWINAKALELLHDEGLALFGGSSGMRDKGLFEPALARPQNMFAYEEDCTVEALAAAYCFGLAKNHPFVDGNKRVAFLSVGMFLGLNGFRLQVDQIDAIRTILGVASGEVGEAVLSTWIGQNMEPLPRRT